MTRADRVIPTKIPSYQQPSMHRKRLCVGAHGMRPVPREYSSFGGGDASAECVAAPRQIFRRPDASGLP